MSITRWNQCEVCGRHLEAFQAANLVKWFGLAWVGLLIVCLVWDVTHGNLGKTYPSHVPYLGKPTVYYPVKASLLGWCLVVLSSLMLATAEVKKEHKTCAQKPDLRMWLVPPVFGVAFLMSTLFILGVTYGLFALVTILLGIGGIT